jgi:Zn-dependent peptidase ImmA (M78 family)
MNTIRQIVTRLVRKYGTNDPYEIAARKNILVLVEPLGKTLGYFNTYKRIPMIHINESLDPRQRRFVCAHELGHRILHPHLNTPFLRRYTLFSIDRIEREANAFAVELLLSDRSVRDIACDGALTVREASAAYGIPPEAAYLKTLF